MRCDDLEAPADFDETALVKKPGVEPIAGYRLIEPLGRGAFGEVWRCEAPGGLPKAIKFVAGDSESALEQSGGAARQELQALQHCRTIRHPFILSMERVELREAELIIVMELADRSLHDVHAECRAAGRAGIDRAELLAYMRETAEVLDFLYHEHRLQHLDVKPHNLFLVSKHIKVGDFGLVSSLAERRGPEAALGGGTPLYAAPEAFRGEPSQHSDQYSLAVTYQELLTGTLPFRGKSGRHLMMLHESADPNLEALDPRDRPLVAKALAKDPTRRFPSCLEFIHSLMHERVVAASVTAPPAGMEDAAGTATPDATAPADLAACDAIPGYELVHCQSRDRLSDSWIAVGPDGRVRQAQLLHVPPYRAAVAVDRLRVLTHRGLPPTEVLRTPLGRLFLLNDPPRSNLAERNAACRGDGLPGVPRDELLACFREVARTLDDVRREHELPHLTLQPRHILLHGGRTLVAQLGLAALLWPLKEQPAAGLNARYAAPELSRPGFSPTSDQYSLALIYAEMLMGLQPRPRRSGGRGAGKPDLDLMPVFDRPVLARALADDPAERFATCAEFIDALVNAAVPEPEEDACLAPEVAWVADLAIGRLEPTTPPTAAADLAAAWVLAANNARQLLAFGARHCLVLPDRVVEHRYPVRVIPGALPLTLSDFPRQWGAQVIRADGANLVCRIHAPPTVWQRCFGGNSGLEIHISAQTLADPVPQLVEAVVRLQFYGKAPPQVAAGLNRIAAEVLESVHKFLPTVFDPRRRERWPCRWTWTAIPLDARHRPGPPLEVAGKDLSVVGIGFIAPASLPVDRLYVTPAHLERSPAALVRVLRRTSLPDGRVEIGGVFGVSAPSVR